jgi:hypothetical protein
MPAELAKTGVARLRPPNGQCSSLRLRFHETKRKFVATYCRSLAVTVTFILLLLFCNEWRIDWDTTGREEIVTIKKCLCAYTALLAFSYIARASTITIGTPNFYGAGLSPTFGTLINFDSLTPLSTVSPTVFSAEGVQSIDNSPSAFPLLVLPYSQQSPPNELSTGAADSYAGDITITFSSPTDEVGIGIAEDGTTPATLTVYGVSGNVLGSFIETVPSTTYNAYYVISDPTDDIKSFAISAAQNLAIDDLQFVPTVIPEPADVTFAAVGLALLAGIWRRKAR